MDTRLGHCGGPRINGFSGPYDRLIDNLGNLAALCVDGRIELAALSTDPLPQPFQAFSANAMSLIAIGVMIIASDDDINLQAVGNIRIDPHQFGAPGGLFISNLKTGATQAAAGAVAGEIWVNSTTLALTMGV